MATNGHSGYPLKWFVDQNAARDSWECVICLEVLKDPVQVRDCGHQFCALCIDDILKADPRCPSCRIEISKAVVFEDHAARRLIKKMDVNCCNEGCYWVGNLSSLLQTHMKSCKFLINVVSNDSGKQSDVEELKAKLESLATEISKLNEMHKNDMEQADLQHQNELRRLALKHEADIKEMKIKHETDLKKVDGKRPRKPRRQGLAVPTDGQNNFQPQRTDSHEPRPYNVQGFNAQRRSQTRNRSVNRTENKELKTGDIGLPTNFQDGSHAGWDPRERFDINKLGDRWKIILSKAGVTDNDLKDPETLKFIADFLEKHDGVESFNAQNRELSPPGRSSDIHHHPPPPFRSYGTREGAPAPPPPIQGYSTPSPPPLFRGSSAPPPPPPSQRSSGSAPPLRGYSAAAAPPPPPSQQSAVPPPPRPPKPRRLSLRPPRLQFDDIQQHNHHPHHHFEEV